MEEYGKILLIAMPLFLVLIIPEKMYGAYRRQRPLMDSVSSVSSGITNARAKDVLGLALLLFPMVGWFLRLAVLSADLRVLSTHRSIRSILFGTNIFHPS
jgi:hypothetical protein